MTQGPRRLLETDLGDLGRSLRAAQEQLPSAETLSRLAERFAVADALGTDRTAPEAEPPAPVSPAEPLSALAKVFAGVAAVGTAVLAIALATREDEAPRAATAPPAQTIEVASAAVSAAAPAYTVGAPLRAALRPEKPSSEPVPTPEEPVSPAVPPSPAPLTAASAAPVARERRASSVEPRRSAAPRAGESAPVAAESSSERIPAHESLPTARRLDAEIELLKQARSAVSSDPRAALALIERCRAEFPRGSYAQEREFIGISALVRLGRQEQARARAAAFRDRYPRSAYLPQLERLVGSTR